MSIFATQTDETQVSTTLTYSDLPRPQISRLNDAAGNFIGTVAVWVTGNRTDGSSHDVVMQRFDAAGQRVGGETIVNTTIPGAQNTPTVATLANGMYVVAWEGDDNYGRGTFAQVFRGDGSKVGGELRISSEASIYQYGASVTAVAGGFIVTSTADGSDGSGYAVIAQRVSINGGTVALATRSGDVLAAGSYDPFLINAGRRGDQGYQEVVSLAGGGALHLYSSPDESGLGVFVRVMAANGTLGTEIQVSSGAPGAQIWSNAVQLANGNLFIAWASEGQDGSDYGIYGRIVTAAGVFVTDEFRLNDRTAGPQGYFNYSDGPKLALLADGSVILTYLGYSAEAWEVYGRRFKADGSADGASVRLNLVTEGYQTTNDVVATPGGFRVVWMSDAGHGFNYDVIQRDFGYSSAIATTQPINRLLGEDQVNTAALYNQRDARVIAHDDGSYVILWLSEPGLGTGDGSGWGIFAQRYSAAGVRVAGEFRINEATAGSQDGYTAAMLSDGRFVVAWTGYGPTGSDSYFRVFNANGTAATGDIRVSDNAGEDYYPMVAAFDDGTFAITWTTYLHAGGSQHDVWGRRFNAAGAALGDAFRVSEVNGANATDGSEVTNVGGAAPGLYGDSAGLGGGRFVSIFVDNSGQDGDRAGLYGRIYAANGTAGTIFAINQYAADAQTQASVTVLASGKFVVVWNSAGQDSWADGIFARVFDANGVALTGDIAINANIQYSQYGPRVAALDDGTFVVTWSSDHDDGASGTDVYAARFDANGVQLNQEFRVNAQVIDGGQRYSSVAATAGGFVVTWTDDGNGHDGDLSGVFRQAFRIDGLGAAMTGERAEKPTVALGTSANLIVNPGAELGSSAGDFTTGVTPQGWTRVDGSLSAVQYAIGPAGGIDANSSARIGGGSDYFAGGPGEGPSSLRQTIDVSARAAAIDTGTLAARIGGVFGGAGSDNDVMTMTVRYLAADGSELGRSTIGGITAPQRGYVSDAFARQDVDLVPPGTRTIEVLLVATGGGAYNDAFADNLSLILAPIAVGVEDSAIAIPLTIATTDANTATPETLRVEVAGIPIGATLSDGTRSFTATPFADAVDISGWNRATLTIRPPAESEADFKLEIRATATEPATGDTATTISTITVDVIGVADALVRDGAATRVNSYTNDQQANAELAHHSSGASVIAWQSLGQSGTDWDVYFQRYNNGTPIGIETRVGAVGGNQTDPHVAFLSDGRFVVAFVQDGAIVQQLYTVGGMPSGAAVTVSTLPNGFGASEPRITMLAGGGWLTSFTQSGFGDFPDPSVNGMFAQRFDANGRAVSRSGAALGNDVFLINTTIAEYQDEGQLAATAGGGFIAVWTSYNQDGDAVDSVWAQRFDASGAKVGGEFHVNQLADGTQRDPQIAVLANGNFVVTWHTDTGLDGDNSGTALAARLYRADGTPLTGEFQANDDTYGSQYDPVIVALPDGRFAIAYTTEALLDGRDVVVQLFDQEGDRIGSEAVVSPVGGSRYDYRPTVAYDGTGLTLAWTVDGADGSASGVYARRISLPGTAIEATGGQRVVPTTTPYSQGYGETATLADGSFVVVWATQPVPGTGDVSKSSVRMQRFAADGTRLGGETTVNTLTAGDQIEPSVTALDGGDFVVVWRSDIGDGSGTGIRAQRFNADGSRDGTELQINEGAAGNQIAPVITALHGAQSGGFAVAWQTDDNIWARAFDPTGAALGGDLRISREVEAVTNGDAVESRPRITSGAAGGFTLVWQDSDADRNGYAIIGQRIGFTGNTPVLLGGINADGSAAANNFRVNSYYVGNQYLPDVLTLADGGTVVLWYDEAFADLKAQIINADGTRRGGELSLTPGEYDAQAFPVGTALADGSFVVIWREYGTPDALTDIVGARFSATGVQLERFEVARDTWYRYSNDFGLSIAVEAQGDGFNVVVTTRTSADAFSRDTGNPDANAVVLQHFTVDYGADAGEKIAQRPVLTLGTLAIGAEDSAIALNIAAALANTDGGSETLRLTIDNVPVGARITDGVRSFTATAQEPSLSLAGWTLANLRIIPPADYNGSFTLDVTARAAEAQGDVAFNTGTIRVDVTPVAEVLPDYGAERLDNVFTGGEQYEPAVASQEDGRYLVVWRTRGQPGLPYESVLGQLHAADGEKIGEPFRIGSADAYAWDPRVVALADGTYLVSFSGHDSNWDGVFLQRVSADGVLLDLDGGSDAPGRVQANTHEEYIQGESELTALADGGWIVAWTSYNNDGNDYGVAAQRYAANGNKVGGEIVVNTTTVGGQGYPGVTQLANGSIAYVWQGPTGVFARVYPAAGTATGEIFLGAGDRATVKALANGTFVVAWSSGGDVVAQRLNADGSLAGASFRVNSYVPDAQQEAQIAVLPDGGFVISWTSHAQDGSSWGVYGQRYDALGAAIGTEFRINRTVPGDQSSPAIIAQGDGSGLIVAFEGQDGSGYGTYDIRLPIPDATAQPAIARAQSEQRVNDPLAPVANQQQSDSQIATLADGSYVVTYSSAGQDGSGWSVVARHYEADGDPIAWTDGKLEKVVNITTGSDQLEGNVAALPGGGFIVVYRNYREGAWEVSARRFDADGDPASMQDATGASVSELKITDAAFYSSDPMVTVGADGAMLVTFVSDRIGQGTDIYVHRIDAAGRLAAGGDVLLNQNQANPQEGVRLTALAGGGYVAVWHSLGHDGSDWGIYGRMIGANGVPSSPEFLINTLTDGEQSWPSIAATTNGGFVVAWNTLTGYDADQSHYGIAAQRFTVANGQAVRAGAEFTVNGIANGGQIHPVALGTQDGGFVIAWRSDGADGDSYAIAGRRFDASGNPTEPYGNDFIINTTAAGDQSEIAMALLERGFVTTWTSSENGYDVRMQRFEGAGLEPPPYVVDPLTGNDTTVDKVFATIQEALDAAPEGATIMIRGGTYAEALRVTTDNLKIINAPDETVIITAPAGAAALTVARGLDLTIRGDDAARLSLQGATGQATIVFEGVNGGTEIAKTTIASGSGGSGIVFRGGQDGVVVQDNAFRGANNLSVLGADGTLGLGGSSNVAILRNAFDTSGGFAISSAQTQGRVVQNVFDGQAGLAAASVQLTGVGVELGFNRFQAGVGPHFRDPSSLYDEAAVISGNTFAEGWVRVAATNVIYSTMTQAVGVATSGQTVFVSGGAWTEGVVTVPINNLTISAPGGLVPATGVALRLGTGVTQLNLAGEAAIAVTGNDAANTIRGNAGANTLAGAGGDDILEIGLDGGRDTLDGGAGADRAIVRTNNVAAVAIAGDANGFAIRDGSAALRASFAGVETLSLVLDHATQVTIGALPTAPVIGIGGGGGNNSVDARASTASVFFNGAQGNDTFLGGAALDGILYTTATIAVFVNLSTAAYTVGSVTVAAGTARDEFGGTDTLSGIDYVETGSGNDRVDGGVLAETIIAGAGDDTINGGGGNDRLFGGAGTNTLAGGAGDDIYYVESASDTITEAAGAGTDTVLTALATFSVAGFANVEDLTADSDIAHAFTGNAGANRITGGAGDDVLKGGGGNDVLVGGGGKDQLDGGADFDTADYGLHAAAIELKLADGTARDVSSNVTDTLVSIERIIGTAFADRLFGSAAAETLEGGAGDDLLAGGGGADMLVGGTGSDTVSYGSSVVATTGSLARTGTGRWTFAAGTGEGSDTLDGIEVINLTGADGVMGNADDRTFAIVNGNVAVQSAADTAAATEAGGTANATPAVAATGNVLANDVNLDESAAANDVMRVASARWTSATGPGTGTGGGSAAVSAAGTAIAGRYGTLTIRADGSFGYVLDAAKSDLLAQAATATETFTYVANDGIGADASATLIVTITGRNDAPVVVADSGATTENASVTVNVLSNDRDVDQGATLAIASATAAKGSVSFSGSNITFNPGAAFDHLAAGATEQVAVSYTIRDEQGATGSGTLTVTVTGTNDAPVAVADTATTGENAIVLIDVLANDTDVDDATVKTLVSAAAPAGKGSVSVVDGKLRFDPGTVFDHLALGASEVVTLNYVMRDQAGATSTAAVTLTITGANDAPAGVADTGATTENAAVTVAVLDNDRDVDDGATLTLVSASAAAGKGSASVSGGNVTFTPGTAFDHLAAGATEQVAITYTLRDQHGASGTGTLTITVTGTNDAPIAVADAATIGENGPTLIDVLANDTDADDGTVKTLVSVSTPAGKGTASIVDGKLRFDPGTAFDHLAAGAKEIVTITYVMRDAAGAQSTATLTLTVTGANDAPTTAADSGATEENTAVTVSVLGNDRDVDDGAVLTLVSASAPTGKGSASVSGGSVVFDPGTSFDRLAAGATEDVAIAYTVRDEQGGTATGTLTITVTGSNDAPVAVADTATTGENSQLTIDVLANDRDPDAGGTLTLVSAAGPAGKGTVSVVDGRVRFVPGTAFDSLAAGASEVVTIRYVVRDDKGAESTGTLALTVTGVNDRPVVVHDVASVNENANVLIAPLANDRDPDRGATLSIANLVVPEGRGTAEIINNRIRYETGTDFDRLAPGETGAVRISYDIIDGQGGVTPSYTIVTVNGVNDRPVAKGDRIVTLEDTPVTIDFTRLLGNDRDPDNGQTLTLTGINGPTGGTARIVGNQIVFDPDRDFAGVGTLSYTISDGLGGTDSGRVRVVVRAVNDPAVAQDDAFVVNPARAMVGQLFADNGFGADVDVDSDLRVTSVNGAATAVGTMITLASGATVSVSRSGRMVYNANDAFDLSPGESATDSFTYAVGGGDTATVTLTITAPAEAAALPLDPHMLPLIAEPALLVPAGDFLW